MRHVVYLLVVVNLVFLGWNIFQSQSVMQSQRNMPAIPKTAVPLVTLEEQQQAADEVSTIEKLTDSKPPGASVGLVCQTLGPFVALDAMQEMEEELVDMGLAPQRRESERSYPIGYWVYLPDPRDKEYFIGTGNLISLGAFKEMSRAKERLEKTRKLGLDPVLATRYRTATGYWLDFQTEIAEGKQLDSLVTDSPDIWLQDRACY